MPAVERDTIEETIERALKRSAEVDAKNIVVEPVEGIVTVRGEDTSRAGSNAYRLQQIRFPQTRSQEVEMARETGARDRDEGGESTGVTRPRWRTPAYGPAASPFTFMQRMAEDMDRMFDRFGFGRPGALLDRDVWPAGRDLEQLAWAPQIETFRRDDQLVVRADLPGMKKDDVSVEIDKGTLRISGERREEHEEERDEYYRTERSYGRFYRAIPLPEGTTEEQINATFKDGVLEVAMPAPKEEATARGKRIEIR